MILEETKQVAQASTSSRWWCPGSSPESLICSSWLMLCLGQNVMYGSSTNICWVERGGRRGRRQPLVLWNPQSLERNVKSQPAQIWGRIWNWSERYKCRWRDVCPLQEMIKGFWKKEAFGSGLGEVRTCERKKLQEDWLQEITRGYSLTKGIGLSNKRWIWIFRSSVWAGLL